MEELPAAVSQPQRLVSHARQDAAKRILLLDCDDGRRHVRAEALIERGVLVDRAAETMVARTLWKPGTYDLVLIDLRGADAECAAFIAFVQGECAQQKFGFYLAERPYVTASVAECRSSMHQQTLRRAEADHHPDATRSPGSPGVAEAARRIAALQRTARLNGQARKEPQAPKEPPAPEVREERLLGISASDAVKHAARLLGGS